MNDVKDNTTGEPVKGQPPTTDAENTATPSKSPENTTATPALSVEATSQTIQDALTGTSLPGSYLTDGSMLDTDGALRPEYIGRYAQALADKLKPLKASAFHTAFLREAKEARKKKVPYGVKKNCALGMVTQAKKLAARKKDPAPRVLVDMITAATSTVKDPATFEALYMHLDAVYSYLLQA